jgi:RNA polymerase sigma-70 factor (ECF subfamily)
MTQAPTHEVTQLLRDWSDGNKAALDKLVPLVQAELRRRAHNYMRHERPGHTLQTSALVNEAYLQMVDQKGIRWQDRAHFFATAAQVMRHVLVDYARRNARAKRGGDAQQTSLDEVALVTRERGAELVALDEALSELAALDPRKSEIVELRYFGGLTIEETAAVLKVSAMTVRREWRSAKAWLYKTMKDEG